MSRRVELIEVVGRWLDILESTLIVVVDVTPLQLRRTM